MLSNMGLILASFTVPEHIGTNPRAILWIFPLLASIAIVYKATKMRIIFPWKFIKEVVVLFATLSIFMVLTALGLYMIVWLLTT